MWPDGATIASALALGFIGSVHCAGMCGATAAAVTMRFAMPLRGGGQTAWAARAGGGPSQMAQGTPLRFSPPLQALSVNLLFNLGRLASYAVAGGLIAALAGAGTSWQIDGSNPLRLMLFAAGQLLVIAAGLYVAGLTALLRPLERLGHRSWQRLQPLAASLMQRASSDSTAFALGALWGWIPCGMVYGALALAASTANAPQGAFAMLAFGLGTLPAMLTVGSLGATFIATLRDRRVRLLAGAAIVGMGLFGLDNVASRQDLSLLLAQCRHAWQAVLP